MKAQGRASVPGYEGFLTLAIRMRVSPEPIKNRSRWGEISDHPDCPADDRC